MGNPIASREATIYGGFEVLDAGYRIHFSSTACRRRRPRPIAVDSGRHFQITATGLLSACSTSSRDGAAQFLAWRSYFPGAWLRLRGGEASAGQPPSAASVSRHGSAQLEFDESTEEEEDDAAREQHHLAMARRSSLTAVVTDVWEKAKRRCDAAEEVERNLRKGNRASIWSEMARCTHVIVDYDDESDLCNDSTGESDTFA